MNENQKKHARKKLFLKIFGCIFSAAGIVLAVIGFADFFGAAAEADMPDKFWCVFAGFPLLFIGIAMLLFGFRKEIARYVKDESAPVLNEFAEDIRPAVRSVSSAVQDAKGERACPKCGEINSADAKFCNHCGAQLKKVCPACGGENDGGAKFCNQCGAALDK